MKNRDIHLINEILGVYEKSKFATERILDSVSSFFVLIDHKGMIYRGNKNAADLFGVDHEYLPGKKIFDLLSSEQCGKLKLLFKKLCRKQIEDFQLDLDFSSPDGTKTFLWDVKPLEVSLYNLTLFKVNGTDVTNFQMRIEERITMANELEALRRKNRRLNLLINAREIAAEITVENYLLENVRNIMEYLPFDTAIIWTVNSEMHTIAPKLVDSLSVEVTPFVPREFYKDDMPFPIFDAVKNKQSYWLQSADLKKLRSQRAEAFYNVYSTSILLSIVVNASTHAVLEFKSQAEHPYDEELFDTLQILANKLSEQVCKKVLIQEIDARNKQLSHSAKMSALGEMAGNIAHEINNPLTIIYGNICYCIKQAKTGSLVNEAILDRLEASVKTINRIAKVIRGMKAFSRNSDGDPMKSTFVPKILEDTLDLCIDRFKSHRVTLKSSEVPSVHIECRDTQIIQVLVNLLNNAFDAVSNLENPWVQIEVFESGEEIQIEITDSGPGIPPEISEKIMRPFFTTKEPGKGTGLGLSISLGIIKNHNGEFYLDRDFPNTKFVILLKKKVDESILKTGTG
jgi:PAS domain S-box-containing protein